MTSIAFTTLCSGSGLPVIHDQKFEFAAKDIPFKFKILHDLKDWKKR